MRWTDAHAAGVLVRVGEPCIRRAPRRRRRARRRSAPPGARCGRLDAVRRPGRSSLLRSGTAAGRRAALRLSALPWQACARTLVCSVSARRVVLRPAHISICYFTPNTDCALTHHAPSFPSPRARRAQPTSRRRSATRAASSPSSASGWPRCCPPAPPLLHPRSTPPRLSSAPMCPVLQATACSADMCTVPCTDVHECWAADMCTVPCTAGHASRLAFA